MKKYLGYALLAFVGISLAYAVFDERRQEPRSDPAPQAVPATPDSPTPRPPSTSLPAKKAPRHPSAAAKPTASRKTVVARYCHGTARCSNCIKIEQYSREAIETGLRKELDSGRLRFEVVNIEEPANRHFVKDYGLYTKSLVLIAETGGKEGRYKVLEDVWDHLDDKEAFIAYVKAETEAFLE